MTKTFQRVMLALAAVALLGMPLVAQADNKHVSEAIEHAKEAVEHGKKGGDVARRRCPACRKIADGFIGGVVTLRGSFVREHREEIRNLVRNEEKRAMAFNPLARIIILKEDESGFEVSTTAEKLAQRIGREVHKACSGTVEYKWSEDSKP